MERQRNGALDNGIGHRTVAFLASVFFGDERLQMYRREIIADLDAETQEFLQ